MLDPKTQKKLDDLLKKYEGKVQKRPRIDGEECPDWFHLGQRQLWNANPKITLLLAGRQSGKP